MTSLSPVQTSSLECDLGALASLQPQGSSHIRRYNDTEAARPASCHQPLRSQLSPNPPRPSAIRAKTEPIRTSAARHSKRLSRRWGASSSVSQRTPFQSKSVPHEGIRVQATKPESIVQISRREPAGSGGTHYRLTIEDLREQKVAPASPTVFQTPSSPPPRERTDCSSPLPYPADGYCVENAGSPALPEGLSSDLTSRSSTISAKGTKPNPPHTFSSCWMQVCGSSSEDLSVAEERGR